MNAFSSSVSASKTVESSNKVEWSYSKLFSFVTWDIWCPISSVVSFSDAGLDSWEPYLFSSWNCSASSTTESLVLMSIEGPLWEPSVFLLFMNAVDCLCRYSSSSSRITSSVKSHLESLAFSNTVLSELYMLSLLFVIELNFGRKEFEFDCVDYLITLFLIIWVLILTKSSD